MASAHTQAKKNLTKAEFKLFSGSFPTEIKASTRRHLNSAIFQLEKLLRKYRTARSTAGERDMRLVEFRLKSLAQAQQRYQKKLDRMDQDTKKLLYPRKKSLTVQPKMKVELKDSPRDHFLYQDKQKIYDNSNKALREKHAFENANMKRVAGYSKARSRKAQVARDRVTSAKESA
ncbi:hypothetical protein [Bdellovibrio sp. NC01]|uniref:hypothetical protein n=1 Tax=Bdellovibrio sp. NC01 TaxID=2220073 RepID=UPI00115AF5C8|nr:hypothetical protein [Bdellovibrio sp. NC01]QDK36694.1 hypothetical protein DOE51_03300 [Bdellovibrio sp. NC01]